MKENNDILLTDEFDLMAKDGDLVTGDVLIQQQALLLSIGEGELKQSPATGIGSSNYLNDESEISYFRKIRLQFKNDGLRINSLTKTDQIKISASHA